MRVQLLTSSLVLALVSGCGGEGNGGETPIAVAPPPSPAPAPSPPPAPAPPPAPPSPLPGTGAGSIEFLHVFGISTSDGLQPNGPLLRASDGNFYGTTKQGGSNTCSNISTAQGSCGVVFRAAPSGQVSVLHDFKGPPGDGHLPFSGLIQGRDGALYGLTTQGGAGGRGVAFRLGLDGSYKVLHHFHQPAGSGDRPLGALVQARDGNFYGTTLGGGPNRCDGGDCGTVFRLTPEGDYRVLYAFGSRPGDGAVPNGSLVEGDDGALYGTTIVGGDANCSDPNLQPRIDGCGTVFRVTTSGELTVLYAFPAGRANGILPNGGLTKGPDGAFYGATRGGGGGLCINDSGGCGVIFRITPAGGFSLVYEFSKPETRLPGETISGTDGFAPTGDLWFGRDGLIYGATASGGVKGARDAGTLFSLTTSGTKTILYRFDVSQNGPAVPMGGLIEGADGVFWGVTDYNGMLGASGNRTGFGTLFRLTVPKRP